MLYICQAGTVLNIHARKNFKKLNSQKKKKKTDLLIQDTEDENLSLAKVKAKKRWRRKMTKTARDVAHCDIFCNDIVFQLSLGSLNKISFQGLFLSWALGNNESPFPPKWTVTLGQGVKETHYHCC